MAHSGRKLTWPGRILYALAFALFVLVLLFGEDGGAPRPQWPQIEVTR